MSHLHSPPLDLTVTPNIGLGPFNLGDSLWRILELLRAGKTTYGQVKVSWDEKDPVKSPILVTIFSSITLIFPPTPSPHEQLLQRIDIVLPSRVSSTGLAAPFSLQYRDQPLYDSSAPLTNNIISKLFGPTFSSSPSSSSILCYPGIGFNLSSTEFSSRSKDGQVERISIFQAQSWGHHADMGMMSKELRGEWEFVPNVVASGSVAKCVVEPGKSITLHYHPSSPLTPPSQPYKIFLHSTLAEDLLLDLGPPLRKYWKEDERFREVWGRGGAGGGAVGGVTREDVAGACWWNYFQLGIDFLIDAAGEGAVIKIMLHSNIPGTALFQRHARCPFLIPLTPSPEPFTHRSSVTSLGQALRSSTSTSSTSSTNPISADEPLASMSFDRTGEPGLEDVVGIGASKILALDGIVAEEAEGGGITSVLIY